METPKNKPWNFCETPEEKCTMNYCDDNGCQNRKRVLVNPVEKSTLEHQIEKLEADKAELLEALETANLQIEYLHEKFKETGSGNAIVSKNKSLIQKHKKQ